MSTERREGPTREQFIDFAATVMAAVMTGLMVGTAVYLCGRWFARPSDWLALVACGAAGWLWAIAGIRRARRRGRP